LKVNTKGYGGRRIKKTASVYTNDKNRPRTDLVIFGMVEKFATIRPKHVNLRGYAGDTLTAKVSITPEPKYPFKILDVRAKDGKNIKFQLDEVESSANGAYELKVENQKSDTGRYFDTIFLDTDSKTRPQLRIRVYGNLRPPKNK
jgi:hypothetical protein